MNSALKNREFKISTTVIHYEFFFSLDVTFSVQFYSILENIVLPICFHYYLSYTFDTLVPTV